MEIQVFRVLRNPKTRVGKGEILNPNELKKGNPVSFMMAKGYQRVLLGFLREIEFATVEDIQVPQCTSRARYLVKVVDAFVREMKNADDRKALKDQSPAQFRSRVLNPILQRQRCGVPDNEPMKVQSAVGPTDRDAREFYLTCDPLHSSEADMTLGNLLYLPSVRLSICSITLDVNREVWDAFHTNTKVLWPHRREREAGGIRGPPVLEDLHLEVIAKERYANLYKSIMPKSVRNAVF